MDSNLINMLLSTIAAVISGVIVFFTGEIWKERWLDPIHEFQTLRLRIETVLMFYSNKYSTSVNNRTLNDNQIAFLEEASKELRSLACELRTSISKLPKCRFKLPSNTNIYSASEKLVGLSNGIPCINTEDYNMCKENRQLAAEISELLRIDTHNSDRK